MFDYNSRINVPNSLGDEWRERLQLGAEALEDQWPSEARVRVVIAGDRGEVTLHSDGSAPLPLIVKRGADSVGDMAWEVEEAMYLIETALRS